MAAKNGQKGKQMSLFNALKASLQEAVMIERGELEAGRITRYSDAEVKKIKESRDLAELTQ